MNQEKRKALWEGHSFRSHTLHLTLMDESGFNAALDWAVAEIRRQAFLEAAQAAKERAERASAAALKLHDEKKQLERDKTVFRALYLHFTSLANELENMAAGALAQSEQEES